MHYLSRLTGRRGFGVGLLIAVAAAALLAWRLRPSPAAASYERGRQLEAIQMQVDARDAYLEAVKLDPRYAPPYRALAELATRVGRPDISVPYWRDFLARDPSAPHVLCRLANGELSAGQELPALHDAEAELRRDPRCPRAHLIAGTLYTRQSEAKLALDHLSVAAQAYPSELPVQLSYARVLSLTGDYDRAEPVLKRILEQDRSHAEPYLWLGYISARRPVSPDTIARAEDYLNRALDLQPDDPDANLEMARLQLARHRPAQALPYAENAVSRRKHHPAGLYLLAQIYQALGRTQDAEKTRLAFQRESGLAVQEKALLRKYNLDRKDTQVALELGRVEIARDRPRAALLFLRDAAALAPQDARIQSAIKVAELRIPASPGAGQEN